MQQAGPDGGEEEAQEAQASSNMYLLGSSAASAGVVGMMASLKWEVNDGALRWAARL